MNVLVVLMLLMAPFVACVPLDPVVVAAPLKQSLAATDQIMQGALVSHDRADMDPIVVMFRGERGTVDKNGFFSFVKKSNREAFEALPLKQKMVTAAESASLSSPESSLFTPSLADDKYYLLITKNIEAVFEGQNDIAGFRQIAGEPHLFFSFIAQNSERANADVLIKPTSLEKRNFVYAPDKTIVVLMNPNRVSKVEYWPMKLDPQFVQIPRIVLLTEKEIEERKLEKNPELDLSAVLSPGNNIGRQAFKSNMRGLELKPLFEEQNKFVVWKKQRKDQPVKVEMIAY